MNTRQITSFIAAAMALVALLPSVTLGQERRDGRGTSADVARGRYLAKIAGCNDCHTPGYGELGGKVEEGRWLTGSNLGWHGPWGTTYPTNVRLYVQRISEGAWITRWRSAEARPPMPWMNLRAMSDGDLRALYRYVKSLGPAGVEAPSYVPPDQQPTPPFVQFPAPPERATPVRLGVSQ